MFRTISTLAATAAIAFAIVVAPTHAATDPNVLCHKTVVKSLEKYKKTYLKVYRVCLDKRNINKIPDPGCLDLVSSAKLTLANQKIAAQIAKKCTLGNLTTVGYRSDCQYGAATAGIGGTCFNLPVTNATEFAECMKCWKGAEFGRYVATLYASHAQEVCGALDDTSPTCSAVGCTSPLPAQGNLGDGGENDCQKMLAKAALNYLIKREHFIEQCMLKGGTRGSCLADPKLQIKLAKAETQKETLIKNKCGNNRAPIADPPFCCRTGMGLQCTVAVDRTDCTDNLGGTVQENKTCGSASCVGGSNDGAACTAASECPSGTCGGSCENSPGGGQHITWWEHCPTNEPCPGPTMSDMDDVIGCVDAAADALVDGLLCLQFPNGQACPTPVLTPTPTPTTTP